MIYILAAQLFRRHIGNRPNHGAVFRDRGETINRTIFTRSGLQLSYPKIQNLYPVIIRNEQVFRLEVPMHDAALMRGNQCLRDLEGVSSSPPDRNRAIKEDLAQGLSFQQLRNDVGGVAIETNIEDGKDVRMIQGGRGPGFLLETVQVVRIVARGRPDQFQGNVAPKALIVCPIDFSHPAGTDLLQNPIVSDQPPDHRNSARPNGRVTDSDSQHPSWIHEVRASSQQTHMDLRTRAHAIICVRLRLYRGYPVISSKGESCAIQVL